MGTTTAMKKERKFHTKDELIRVDRPNPAITGLMPEGYMTGEEFARRVKEHITQYCKKNGIL